MERGSAKKQDGDLSLHGEGVYPLQKSQGGSGFGLQNGTRLRDERNHETHDFTKKSGIVHAEIMAPENAPDWVGDRETLWNRVEGAENRGNSQVAREIEVAIPRELSEDARLALVRRFVSEETVSRGMVADFAIHARDASNGGENPHAHIMLTMRALDLESGGFSAHKERAWNQKELLETWRERWEVCCNEALESAGESARVDHRSLEAQGILREATIHLGKEAFYADKRGLQPERLERQPGLVERSMAPFEAQIEQAGHLDLPLMTPESGANWWERMSAYTQRVTGSAGEWFERTRDKVRSWVDRAGGDSPEEPRQASR